MKLPEIKKALITTIPFGEVDATPLQLLKDSNIQYIINPMGRKFTQSELKKYIQDVDFLIAGTDKIDSEILSYSKQLKFISRVGIGLDSVDLLAARNMDIKISYTPDGPTSAVAEFALNLILTTMRKSFMSHMELKKGIWTKFLGKSIEGSAIGIFGAGRIGKELIRLLSIFHPHKLMVCDPYVKKEEIDNLGAILVDKKTLITEADVISLHLPLNIETKDFISKEEMEIMSDDCILVNTSRGGIINEADLYDVMSRGHLGAAAIDVFEYEPYSGKLNELDNCFLTSHMAPMSENARIQMEIDATKEVIRFYNNDKLKNPVPDSEYEKRR